MKPHGRVYEPEGYNGFVEELPGANSRGIAPMSFEKP
jgi:hypothetical protein